MAEAVEVVDADTHVRFHSPEDPYRDGYQFRTFTVDVTAPGITAATSVRNIEDEHYSLARYFDQLAEEWRGWAGERRWKALEHQLAISATSDLLGHVSLRFTLLEDPYPGAWMAEITITIDAGEDLRHLARDVRAFLRV